MGLQLHSALSMVVAVLDRLTCDLKGLARLGVDPFAIDKSLLLEERLVIELAQTLVSNQKPQQDQHTGGTL